MSKPVVILVLLFIVLVVLDIIIASVPIVESRVENLTALQEKELETYLAARQLLTTLGTLSIGAMGGFIVNRYKNAPLPNSQIQRAVISWTCSGASIYLGQVSHDKVLCGCSEPDFSGFRVGRSRGRRRASSISLSCQYSFLRTSSTEV